MAVKTHIVKTEEGEVEKAVQVRAADPGAPVSNQLWINSTDKKMKYYDGATAQTIVSDAAAEQVVSKTTTYTAQGTDGMILADASGGAFTITLYASSGNTGNRLTIKKTDSSVNFVTIDGDSAETIDGDLTFALRQEEDSVTIICDGSNWHIVESHIRPAIAFVEDQKSSGTSGGTSSTTPVARDLNTLSGHVEAVNVSLAGTDGFILNDAGEYLIEWFAPAYNSDRHKTALYNETTASYLKMGTSEYADNATNNSSESKGKWQGVLPASTELAIFHEVQNSVATTGWGREVGSNLTIDSGAAANELYTQVKITKLS